MPAQLSIGECFSDWSSGILFADLQNQTNYKQYFKINPLFSLQHLISFANTWNGKRYVFVLRKVDVCFDQSMLGRKMAAKQNS